MRVRSQSLKGRGRFGNEVKRRLEGLDGVSDVALSALTGSVVIRFDPDRTDPAQIGGCLIELGLLDPAAAATTVDPYHTLATRAGMHIGRAAAGWALGRLLQSSGLSLLAALI
jgi:copper chaperone CopZ